jgi:hypothetical protein
MAGNLLSSKAYYHILNKESAPWVTYQTLLVERLNAL